MAEGLDAISDGEQFLPGIFFDETIVALIQNDVIKVTFNKDGSIGSLFDKKNNKELVKDYFNKLTVYSDPFMYYNARDINMEYMKVILK